MTVGRKLARVVVWAGVIAMAVLLVSFVYPLWASNRELRATQRAMAYHIDHLALAGACRDLWQRRDEFGANGEGGVVEPNDPRLPAMIRDLHPTSVGVSPSGVKVELGGGFIHHGFDAVFGKPTDADVGPMWQNTSASRRVADGLWYYAENGVPTHE